MPWIRKAPKSTASITLGGMPKVSKGIKEVEVAALLADSGEATPSIARMLPVFLWRVRKDLDLGDLASEAVRLGHAQVLGYFLDVAGKISSTRTFQPVVRTLHRQARADRPVFLFPETAKHPFEALAARRDTPAHARRWGLLTRTPLAGYRSYFARVASL